MDVSPGFRIDPDQVRFEDDKYSLEFQLPDGRLARLTHDCVEALVSAAEELYQQQLKRMQEI